MAGVFVLSARNFLQQTVVLLDDNETFEDAFLKATANKNISPASIASVKLREKQDSPSINVSPEMLVSVAKELSCKYIEIELKENRSSSICNNGASAFDLMMSVQKKLILPSKPTTNNNGKLTGPQRLYSDCVDLCMELHCGWSADCIESGEKAIKTLSNALWIIDCCHTKLADNSCHVPKIFQNFQGYNNFTKMHRKAPVLTVEKLTETTNDLANVISFPSMNAPQNKSLAVHLETLLQCLVKYRDRLKNYSEKQSNIFKKRTEPSRSPLDASCIFIEPKPKIEGQYSDLDTELKQVGDFFFVDLDMYSPQDRVKRRNFIQNMRLSMPIMLYRMAYGGSLGTLNFAWTVPVDDSPMRADKNSKVIAEITSTLPKFSTRAMRREFIERYVSYVKCPKSILRHMYNDLTGCEPSSENADQRRVDERVADILLSSDDPNLLFDLRAMNGNDSHFDTFYEAMGQYFEEQLLQVHERRHGEEMYIPFALSIEDLKSEIEKRVPAGTPIPCNESIRLQFMPSNQFQKTALRHTGRFNVKFRVQTRMSRVHHPDAHYVAAYLKYMKEFCVLFRDSCIFVCMDDKAIIPVGEPGKPISTGVRGHNRVLAPFDGPQLVATDHDFHLCGLVPSVSLVTEIPENSSDSFFGGKIFVSTKDKVFQPSTPFRHFAELLRILRLHYSDNDVDLKVPVLCLMTDGGPDHRVTYETVKTSLVELFISLDLDMLIALRTAPHNSWVNPAERCMSILNLALQHVALSRDKMDDRLETLLKNKSSLNAVRNIGSVKPDLKKAFEASVGQVIDVVNDRFARMSLKGEKITVFKGVSDEIVEESLQAVKVATCMPAEDSLPASSKSQELWKNKYLQDFIEKHGIASHYCFQLKKCTDGDCMYCTSKPVRDQELFEMLNFLPEPKPDATGEHYLPFHQIFGQDITVDSYRPSTKNTSGFDETAVEHDKQNRDVFKAGKLRDVLKCGECNKPRCVYSNAKTTREQDVLLRRCREENGYTCGDSLTMLEEAGLYMKSAVGCSCDIELTYFGSGAKTFLPPICVYCGSEENLLNDYDYYVTSLCEKYSVVRPICSHCRRKGLEAKTWGAKFFKKRK